MRFIVTWPINRPQEQPDKLTSSVRTVKRRLSYLHFTPCSPSSGQGTDGSDQRNHVIFSNKHSLHGNILHNVMATKTPGALRPPGVSSANADPIEDAAFGGLWRTPSPV